MCVCVLHACPGANRGQKRVSDLLELELQMVVNQYVVLGTQSWPSARAESIHNNWAISVPGVFSVTWGALQGSTTNEPHGEWLSADLLCKQECQPSGPLRFWVSACPSLSYVKGSRVKSLDMNVKPERTITLEITDFFQELRLRWDSALNGTLQLDRLILKFKTLMSAFTNLHSPL